MQTDLIVGIDAAFTDIFIDPPANVREVLLQRTGDLTTFEKLPLSELSALARSYPGAVKSGGTITNMLAQVAALGGRAALLGVTGDDEYGRIASANLAMRNIRQILPPRAGAVSPQMYCLRDGEETLYNWDYGNGLDLTATDIPDDIAEDAPILALQMSRLLKMEQPFVDRIEQIRRYGGKLALGMQYLRPDDVARKPALKTMFNSADYIFGNRAEYYALLECSGAPLESLLAHSRLHPSPVYVLTQSAGLMVAVQEGLIIANRYPAQHKLERPCMVGAGDAVMAGVLYGNSVQHPTWTVDHGLHLGALCAENILTIEGGQPHSEPGHLRQLVHRCKPPLTFHA